MTSGTLATVIGGIFVYQNFKINQKRLITDRFSKAVEQLGTANNRMVVLGGIYALSKISQDSSEYYWIVMKVIASFIRGKTLDFAPSNTTKPEELDGYPKVFPEVQEAINVIVNRNYKQDVRSEVIDLRGSLFVRANLLNANLRKINLKSANFGDTNLKGVDFSGANLEQAVFCASDLRYSILKDAKLFEAKYCSQTKFPPNFNPERAGMKQE
ncbi:MAG: pentapeptide repeat-containing protein [Tildeniella torsiva UHER 1998/13D]|nr:pentapeptide repeat-containing protein [Tildeniella torsiva UHER 1998/13D]